MDAAIGDIPIGRIAPLNGGELTVADDAVVLETDPRYAAWSAQLEFAIPEIDRESRLIAVRLSVERGVLAVGWLQADEQAWVIQASATAGTGPTELRLSVPAGTPGGKLVFVNWTEGEEQARGQIQRVTVLETVDVQTEYRLAIAAEEAGDAGAATGHYKAALRLNPADVGSIAGLGRVQFVPPNQPLIDEMARRNPIDICEVVIAVRNPCNYRCFYCVGAGSNNEPVKRFDFNALEKKYKSIESKLIVTSFECGGGEPTVHPQFPQLLELCARYGVVSFPSNNSQNPRRWLPRELAKRIEIRAALHPEGEEKLDRYLDYAKYLIEAGCRFSCVFIAHPERLSQVAGYSEKFHENDIPFFAIPFIGMFNGERYPYSYTPDERQILEQNSGSRSVPHTMIRINAHVNRIRNFRGIPCLAGHRLLYLRESGTMQRCLYDGGALEAPLNAAEPCRVKSCGCGLYLDKLNFSQTVDMHNYYAEQADISPEPVEWREEMALGLGYESLEVGLATEYMAVYDALMAAYGKDEFPE